MSEYRRLLMGEWATPPATFDALGRFRDRAAWVRWRLSPRAARLFVCQAIVRNVEPCGPGSSWIEECVEATIRNAAMFAVGASLAPVIPYVCPRRLIVPMGTRPHRQPVVIDSLWEDDPYPDAARCGMYEPGLLALYARPAGWRSSWETEQVRGLAAAINADPLAPRQDLAPILADALEEAGVGGGAADLWFDRLRSHPYPMPPGCWVIEYGRLTEGVGVATEKRL